MRRMEPLVAPRALKLPMTRMRSSTIISMAEMSVKAATIIISVKIMTTFMSSICSQAKKGRLFCWVVVTKNRLWLSCCTVFSASRV